MLTSLIPKHSVPSRVADEKCGRYFCNYCLKGSYQINVDSLSKPAELTAHSHAASQASTCNNSEAEKDKSKDKSKSKSILKDWCCPWCLNDCFCSRCLREEQILKLVTTFFFYEGDLQELLINLLSYHPILKALRNHIVLSNLEIKDFSFLERQCKISKGGIATDGLNGEMIDGEKNKKHIRLSKKGMFESLKNTKSCKSVKMQKPNAVTKLVDLEYKVQQLDDLIESCQTLKKDYRKIQISLSKRTSLNDPAIKLNGNVNIKKTVGRPKKGLSLSFNPNSSEIRESNNCLKAKSRNIKINTKKFKKVVEDGKRIANFKGSLNLLRRKRSRTRSRN